MRRFSQDEPRNVYPPMGTFSATSIVAVLLLAACGKEQSAREPLQRSKAPQRDAQATSDAQAQLATASPIAPPPSIRALFTRVSGDTGCQDPFPQAYAFGPFSEPERMQLDAAIWLNQQDHGYVPVRPHDEVWCYASGPHLDQNFANWCCRADFATLR